MRKAIATIATGPAADLLGIALPTFCEYAERHAYEIVIGSGGTHGRAPSWGKVPLLQQLLTIYEFVLWIDADALIIDPSVDLETVVPADAFQAFALVTLPDKRTSPCAGVWAFRAGARAQEFLAAVWAQEDLIAHPWWEQAALMRLTGWTLNFPVVKAEATGWDEGTFVLDEEWDMIPAFPAGYAPARIRHYLGWPYSRRALQMRTDIASIRGSRARYWIGLAERRRPTYWRAAAVARYWRNQPRGSILRRLRGGR